MPFKSKAQRAFLYAKHPAVAAEFQKHTPKDAKLPDRLHEAASAMLKGKKKK
jgi:hypothetical protein